MSRFVPQLCLALFMWSAPAYGADADTALPDIELKPLDVLSQASLHWHEVKELGSWYMPLLLGESDRVQLHVENLSPMPGKIAEPFFSELLNFGICGWNQAALIGNYGCAVIVQQGLHINVDFKSGSTPTPTIRVRKQDVALNRQSEYGQFLYEMQMLSRSAASGTIYALGLNQGLLRVSLVIVSYGQVILAQAEWSMKDLRACRTSYKLSCPTTWTGTDASGNKFSIINILEWLRTRKM